MKLRLLNPVLRMIFFGVLLGFPGSANAEELTKPEAFALLKANGFRWKQTETLVPDADAKEMQANSATLPHINLNLREYGTRINEAEFGFTDKGSLVPFVAGQTAIQVGYNIYDRLSEKRLKAAQANQLASVANTRQYQDDLTYVMLAQFLNAQRQKKRIEVIDASLARDTQIAKAAEVRQGAGLGTRLDGMRSSALLESDRLRQLDAQMAYHKALEDLAVTLGQNHLSKEPGPLVLHEAPLPDTVTDEIHGLDRIVETRADVIAAKATKDAADMLVLSARGEYFPKITAAAEVGYLDVGILGIGGPVTFSVGLQLTLPLYSGGLIAGRVQEEAVKATKAELQVKQLELESQSQIHLSISHFQEAKMAIRLTERQLQIAEEELRLAQHKFSAGSGNGLELSNSQVSMANAQDTQVEVAFNYELARATYFKAIGKLGRYFELEGKGEL